MVSQHHLPDRISLALIYVPFYICWRVDHLQKLRSNALSHLLPAFLTHIHAQPHTHTRAYSLKKLLSWRLLVLSPSWSDISRTCVSSPVCSHPCLPGHGCARTSVSACVLGTSLSLTVQSSDHILLLDTETTWPLVDKQDPHMHIINDHPILALDF